MLFARNIAPAVGAAIATGIGAVASSGLNAWSQARTNAQNREQANYAFQQQQQAIREMNAYNSPAQQVVRMKSAGLNPSLAFGADGNMVGNQADVPAYNAIPAEAPNVGALGSGIAQAVQTGIEVRDLQRRQDLAVAEIASKDYQNFLALTQGELNIGQLQETLELLDYKKENYESLTQLNWDNVLKARQEVINMKENIEVMRKQIELTDAQIDELAARVGLERDEAIAILAKLPHEIAQMDANAAFAWASTDVAREQIYNLVADRTNMMFYQDLENRKFNFETGDKLKFEAELTKYKERVNVMNHVQDNIAKVITLGVGYSALKNGNPLPPVNTKNPRPGHHGTSYSTYSDFTPATGQYQYRKPHK